MVATTAGRARTRSRRILVGTASWADPGFTEWYPRGLPARQRLAYYAERFDLVEVNSSFYAIPKQEVVASWVEQTPRKFVFDFKLFQLLSRHRTTLNRLPPDLRRLADSGSGKVNLTPALERKLARRIIDAIAPLHEARKLGALLLQLTPSFGPRTHRLEELDDLVDDFHGYKLAVELRHRGWVQDKERAHTEKYFRSRKLAYVTVDAPASEHFMAMPPLDLVTRRDLAYLRAHGRNRRGYLHGRTVAERFDYDYSEDELREIVERVEHLAQHATHVHVLYNNNKSDYALRAATRTREILEETQSDSTARPPGRGGAHHR